MLQDGRQPDLPKRWSCQKQTGGENDWPGGDQATRTIRGPCHDHQQSQVQAQFDELKAGDRVEVEHVVTVGQKSWTTKTCGTVVRTERRRHGLHFQRNHDDKVFSDVVLLELPDGELTSVTIDEFTTIRRA